jgi:hypothetical protein
VRDNSTRLEGEEGANAVEFALLLPLLIVLIFGTLTGGLMLNHHLSVTQAAREGARYGATLQVADDQPSPDWYARVRERAARASAGSLDATEVICLWYLSVEVGPLADAANPGGCPGSPPGQLPGADEGDQVLVYAERLADFDLILYSFDDLTLKARAVARHEGGLG